MRAPAGSWPMASRHPHDQLMLGHADIKQTQRYSAMPNMLTTHERYLYHQIHPLKLLTDIASGFGSLIPLWRHELGLALIVMLVPPPIASALVLHFVNLEPQRDSAFGRYIARTMTRSIEAVRLAGMIVIALGGWHRSLWTIAVGLVVVVFGWTRGLMVSRAITLRR